MFSFVSVFYVQSKLGVTKLKIFFDIFMLKIRFYFSCFTIRLHQNNIFQISAIYSLMCIFEPRHEYINLLPKLYETKTISCFSFSSLLYQRTNSRLYSLVTIVTIMVSHKNTKLMLIFYLFCLTDRLTTIICKSKKKRRS